MYWVCNGIKVLKYFNFFVIMKNRIKIMNFILIWKKFDKNKRKKENSRIYFMLCIKEYWCLL